MPPRLIASDLDGTLLRSDGTVSARTRRALGAAADAGSTVVLATGRPIRFVRGLAVSLGIDTPLVCANGAVVYDHTGDRVLHERCLGLDAYHEVLRTLRSMFDGLAFGVESSRSFACDKAFAELAVWPLPDEASVGELPINGSPAAKVLVRHPALSMAALMAEVQQAVGHVASVTRSTPHLLEIAALGVDKASAVAALADERHTSAEDTVAFGDMPNDIAMLRWAGHGVAVANADKAVRDVADALTESNDEDGVAQVVEGLYGLVG